MKVAIVNTDGKKTGKEATLSPAVFGLESNDHLLYLAVKQHQANKRQGTHKSKERSEITGSSRKVKKQKGTGTARFGDIKNPIFRGGGRIFGPEPRVYWFKINKKVKSKARKIALSNKARENNILVLDDMKMDAPSTKGYVNILQNLGVAEKKTLVVLSEADKNIYLSSRNIPKTHVMPANEINTYDILNADNLVFTAAALKSVEESFAN